MISIQWREHVFAMHSNKNQIQSIQFCFLNYILTFGSYYDLNSGELFFNWIKILTIRINSEILYFYFPWNIKMRIVQKLCSLAFPLKLFLKFWTCKCYKSPPLKSRWHIKVCCQIIYSWYQVINLKEYNKKNKLRKFDSSGSI